MTPSETSRVQPDVLLAVLLRRVAPGVWTVPELTAATVEALVDAVPELVHLDFTGLSTKAEVLAALGKQASFPDYYGQNWDAAFDCLTDLTPVIVVVRGLEDPESDVTRILVDLMIEASEFWASRGEVPAYVLIAGVSDKALPAINHLA